MIKKIKRYLKLYLYLTKFSVMSVLIYRLNSLIMGLTPVVWMLGTISFLFVIFSGSKEIAGWSFFEVMLLTGIHELLYLFGWLTFINNLHGFIHLVDQGKFDAILLKPVNHRFFVSFNSIDLSGVLGGLFNTLFLISFSLVKLRPDASINRILFSLVSLVISYLIFYLMIFLLSSLSLYWIKAETFVDWLLASTEFDRYPGELYDKGFRFFLSTFFPILFVSYVPTAVLLGKLSWHYVIFGLLLVVWLYTISTIIWRKGLRHYQGASS